MSALDLGDVLWNPPAAVLGARNALVSRAGAKRLEPLSGALSVKHMLTGYAHWSANGRRFRVEGDAFLVLNHGTVYTLERRAQEPSRSFCVFFARGFAEEAMRALRSSDAHMLDAPEERRSGEFLAREQLHAGTPRVAARLVALARAIDLGAVTPLGVEAAFAELAAELVGLESDVAAARARLPAARASTRAELQARLQRARERLHDGLEERLSLGELARAACLSPHHLQRTFRALFGESPQNYRTRLRLARARRLLRDTDRDVTEICAAVGFESLGSFSTLFRRALGRSPGAYRREIRKIGEAGGAPPELPSTP